LNTEIYIHEIIALTLSIYFLKLINYKFFTIKGVTLLYFIIFYSGAILLVIIDSIYFRDFLITNPIAVLNTLHAYNVFIGIFVTVELFLRSIKKTTKHKDYPPFFKGFNNKKAMLFILFFIAALIIRMNNNLYYHVSIDPNYNLSLNTYQNIINRLHWLGLLPIFFMQYKYFRTGKVAYIIISATFVIFMISAYLPSGSRTTAFLFFPIFIIYILSELKKHRLLLTLGAGILLSILVVFSGKMRVTDANLSHYTLKDDSAILVHRLFDAVITGKIMERVPNDYDYRNYQGMEILLYTPFPGFVRSEIGMPINFTDGPLYIRSIGLTPSWTSVPVTLLGDFYSRFGWYGIILLSIFLSLILRFLDNIILKRGELFKLTFMVLYSAYASQIYIVDMQVFFVSITREFIISYILASLIVMFIVKKIHRVERI
jgi:hypothetical protein